MNINAISKTTPATSSDLMVAKQNQTKTDMRIAFPFLPPEQSTSPLTGRDFIASNYSPEDLAKLMAEKEREIDEVISKIKSQKSKTSVIDGGMAVKSNSLELVNKARDYTTKGMDYLESVLPSDIIGDPDVASRITQSYAVLELSQVIQNALDSGLTRLANMYKGKLLDECANILKEVKKNYEMNNEKVPAKIKEWEMRINHDRDYLSTANVKLGFTMGKRAISILKLPSIKKILSQGEPYISKGLSIVGPAIGFVLSVLGLQSTEDTSSKYNSWVEKYKAWQKKTEAQGPIVALNTDEQPKQLSSVKKIAQNMKLPEQQYNTEFKNLVNNRSFSEICSVLKQCDFELDASIKTKEQFVDILAHQTGFKKQIMAHYFAYRNNLHQINAIIEGSENLVVKREAIVEKKLLQLRIRFEEIKPQLYKVNKSHFDEAFKTLMEEVSLLKGVKLAPHLKATMEKLGLTVPANVKTLQEATSYLISIKTSPLMYNTTYKKWFSIQPRDGLLKKYIDHQETLEQATKNAMKVMVSKKHELDGKFLKSKLVDTRLSFSFSTATTICTTVTGLLAYAALPALAGVAVVAKWLSVASTAAGYGFMGLGYFMSYKYQNSSFNLKTYFENISFNYSSLRANLQNFSKLASQKKLKATEEIVNNLQKIHKKTDDTNYDKALVKALDDYKKAKGEFEASERKLNYWKEKAKKLGDSIAHKAWQDYVQFASLKIDETGTSFDTIKALESALHESDVSLFDPETKKFFEVQLGINLPAVQKEMEKNPKALKDALKNLFTMDEGYAAYFFTLQQKRINIDILPAM